MWFVQNHPLGISKNKRILSFFLLYIESAQSMSSSSGEGNNISVVEIDLSDRDDRSVEEIDRLFEQLQYYETVGTITLDTRAVPSNLHRFVSLDRLTLQECVDIDCAMLPRSISYLDIGADSNKNVKNLSRMANLVSLTVNRSQLLEAEPLLSVEHPLLQVIIVLGIGSDAVDERLIKRFTYDLRQRIELGLVFLGYKHSGNTATNACLKPRADSSSTCQ